MQLLPTGLAMPPLSYAVVLLAVGIVSTSLLYAIGPPVTQRQVVAFVPWMLSGGILHVFNQIGVSPDLLAPLFAAPAVYVTTYDLLAVVLLISAFLAEVNDRPERIARDVGAVGLGLFVVLAGLAYWRAAAVVESNLAFGWPPLGFVGAALLAVLFYYPVAIWQTGAVARAGYGGAVAVYAHALDGFSTALGVDVLGSAERSPIPRRIMDFAADLPTEPFLGQGWLFVLVKMFVAVGLVLLLADYVEEEPTEGNLLLAFVAAVGLGPAANNLFLFLVTG